MILPRISVAEQVAKISDIPSMNHATGSFLELGAMPHVETSALDGQQMNYSYICKHCKRPADTISLLQNKGPSTLMTARASCTSKSTGVTIRADGGPKLLGRQLCHQCTMMHNSLLLVVGTD